MFKVVNEKQIQILRVEWCYGVLNEVLIQL